MKFVKYLLIIPLIIQGFQGIGQTSYHSERLTVNRKNIINIHDIKHDYLVNIQNLESPFEGNSHYRHFLEDLKKESEKRYPYRTSKPQGRLNAPTVDTPSTLKSFQGNLYNYSAPNDNTLAVSKDEIVLSAINTNIIFYDAKNDSLLKTISLSAFSDTLDYVSTHQYDPKVIYDYQKDRFIVVNLAGSSANTTTHIVVGFQLTDDVLGEWAFYAIPGNPLNDTSWTDFPAISLTDNELFITGNLLRYGGSWQTSFKQTVIWQIDKNSGFSANQNLSTRLYSDIKFNGVNIRNLHPVMGGSGFYGPEMYFMSNKNFSVLSDTFFLLKTTGLLNNPATALEIKLIKSDNSYGAPPNPRMPANKRLATNDARVLGAIFENDIIQFVGNTIDTSNGFATIYHGLIYEPETATEAKLKLIQHDSLNFGYPNISYCGTNFKSLHSIITFNYTGETVNPGFCAMFFEKEGSYSDLKILKTGETYINVLLGGLQRWGDYSGSQPLYGEPGKVWVCGTFGKANPGQRVYGTWISKLQSSTEDEPVFPMPNGKSYVFPNPSQSDVVSVVFELNASSNINVDIVDMQGKTITIVSGFAAKQGVNQLSFSTLSLAKGSYVLRIYEANSLLHSSTFVVAF